MNFETLNICLFSLRGKEEPTEEYLAIERSVVESLKSSSSTGGRILSEWIYTIDNLKTREEHKEF
jgi:hypothetical protein